MSDPKATVDDLKDEGFQSSQFGAPADWDAYLGKVLAQAGRWTEQKLGALAYAAVAANSYAFDCLVKAEVQYSSAVLFRRRVVFYESNASNGLDRDNTGVLAELRRQEALAVQNANYWLGEALRAEGQDDSAIIEGTGLSAGVVETGRFPPQRVAHG